MARTSAQQRKKSPLCKGKPFCRGLSQRDYALLWNAVKRGETTWEAAERAGACLRRGETRMGRPAKAFAKRFASLANPKSRKGS